MRRRFRPYHHDRRRGSDPRVLWFLALLGVLIAVTLYRIDSPNLRLPASSNPSVTVTASDDHGGVLGIDSTQVFTAAQAAAVAHQNYGAVTPPVTTGITKITFRYRSRDADGTPLTIYGRAYIPAVPKGKLPIFAFAPGTTGIGDQCAASLEQPQKVSWGNYDSHMITYASQGYVGVTTDYEGMRDNSRIHHYMVGELEGRALLDAVIAVSRLPQAHAQADTRSVFLAGYSQGGHAAFWADKIAADYAPQLGISGVVGFGSVMSVAETLGDVVYGANINWFGPYVLTSYEDYYKHDYPLDKILQPVWIPNLKADVTAHCIDTDIAHWGRDPQKVYQPAFLSAFTGGTLSSYVPSFALDLDRNLTGDQATTSAKRINQGKLDNVVLPRQQEAILPIMCAKSLGPVQYALYPATHYNTMVKSLGDTLAWMAGIRAGQKPVSTCPTVSN